MEMMRSASRQCSSLYTVFGLALLFIQGYARRDPCDLDVYTILDDHRRDVSSLPSSSQLCDLDLASGWYRFFINGSDASIPTTCVQPNHCGTQAPIWIDLDMPPQLGQEVTSVACSSWSGQGHEVNCCFYPYHVTVKNCGRYFVYKLGSSLACNIAYCAEVTSFDAPTTPTSAPPTTATTIKVSAVTTTTLSPTIPTSPITTKTVPKTISPKHITTLTSLPTNISTDLTTSATIPSSTEKFPSTTSSSHHMSTKSSETLKTTTEVLKVLASDAETTKEEDLQNTDSPIDAAITITTSSRFVRNRSTAATTSYSVNTEELSTHAAASNTQTSTPRTDDEGCPDDEDLDPLSQQCYGRAEVKVQVQGDDIFLICDVRLGGDASAARRITWCEQAQFDSTAYDCLPIAAKEDRLFLGDSVFTGQTIVCQVEDAAQPDGKLFRSQPFFVGLKIKEQELAVSDNGTSSKVTFTSSVPVPCGAGFDPTYCKLSVNLLVFDTDGHYLPRMRFSTCYLELTNAQCDVSSDCQDMVVEMAVFPDPQGMLATRDVVLIAGITYTGPGSWAQTSVDKQIHVEESSFASCHVVTDPHVLTFDGRTYDLYRTGTFILYYSSFLDFTVEIRVSRCGGHTTGIPGFCVCGVVVAQSDDVISVDNCHQRQLQGHVEVTYPLGAISQDVRVYQHSTKNALTIVLLTGRRLRIYVETFGLNVALFLPSLEKGRGKGLCGNYDNDPSNDFAKQSGAAVTKSSNEILQALEFIESWRLQPSQSRFDQPDVDWRDKPDPFLPTVRCDCSPSSAGDKCPVTPFFQDTQTSIISASDVTDRFYTHAMFPAEESPESEPDPQTHDAKQQPYYFRWDHVISSQLFLPTWPTQSGITQEMADEACAHFLFQAPLTLTCADFGLVGLVVSTAFDFCKKDIQVKDDMSWANHSTRLLESVCEFAILQRSSNFTSITDRATPSQPVWPNDLRDAIGCPVGCGRGHCENGRCVCEEGVTGQACTVEKEATTSSASTKPATIPTTVETTERKTDSSSTVTSNTFASTDIETTERKTDSSFTVTSNTFASADVKTTERKTDSSSTVTSNTFASADVKTTERKTDSSSTVTSNKFASADVEITEFKNDVTFAATELSDYFTADTAVIETDVTADPSKFETDVTADTAKIETDVTSDPSKFETDVTADTAVIETDVTADPSKFETDVTADTAVIETDVTADPSKFETDVMADTAKIETDVTADTTEIRTDVTADPTEIETDVTADTAEIESGVTADPTEIERYVTADTAEIETDVTADVSEIDKDVGTVTTDIETDTGYTSTSSAKPFSSSNTDTAAPSLETLVYGIITGQSSERLKETQSSTFPTTGEKYSWSVDTSTPPNITNPETFGAEGRNPTLPAVGATVTTLSQTSTESLSASTQYLSERGRLFTTSPLLTESTSTFSSISLTSSTSDAISQSEKLTPRISSPPILTRYPPASSLSSSPLPKSTLSLSELTTSSSIVSRPRALSSSPSSSTKPTDPSTPPPLQDTVGVLDPRFITCDISQDVGQCIRVPVKGVFPRGKLRCRFRPVKIRSGLVEEYLSNTVESPSKRLDDGQLLCSITYYQHIPGVFPGLDTGVVTLRLEVLSPSTDSVVVVNYLTVFDSTCLTCDVGGQLGCQIKAGYCYIGYTCSRELSFNPTDPCFQCVPAFSTTHWSPRQDNLAPDIDGQESVIAVLSGEVVRLSITAHDPEGSKVVFGVNRTDASISQSGVFTWRASEAGPGATRNEAFTVTAKDTCNATSSLRLLLRTVSCDCANAGSCENPRFKSSGQGSEVEYDCTCLDGFTGSRCEQLVDACASNPCHRGTCVKQNTGFRCVCVRGFAGELCDVRQDPCASQPCFRDVTCTSSFSLRSRDPQFVCGPCPDGYTGDGVNCDAVSAVSRSSCSDQPCFPGVTCDDLPDTARGYRCGQCPQFFSGDGQDCVRTDISACSTGVCSPVSTCEETRVPPGFRCGPCPSGYQGNGVTCTALCRRPCPLRQTCVGPDQCACAPGYTGRRCDQPTCEPKCLHGGVCVRPNLCRCYSGYTGTYCQTSLCSSSCQNGGRCIGNDRCLCPYGFSGSQCQILACRRRCQNGGRCVGSNRCRCLPGYQGQLCEIPTCFPACLNGGTCLRPGVCACPPGYQGYRCEEALCSPSCQNMGRCLRHNTCKCPHGYTGWRCKTPVCRPVCMNQGRCVGPNQCLCTSGWLGLRCDRPVCRPSCKDGGLCVKPDVCSCPRGYFGADCSRSFWQRHRGRY